MKEYKKNLSTITTAQAGALLGVTTSSIRAMVIDGRLSGVQPKFRAHMHISLAAVQELAAERQRIEASHLELRAARTRKMEAALAPPDSKARYPSMSVQKREGAQGEPAPRWSQRAAIRDGLRTGELDLDDQLFRHSRQLSEMRKHLEENLACIEERLTSIENLLQRSANAWDL